MNFLKVKIINKLVLLIVCINLSYCSDSDRNDPDKKDTVNSSEPKKIEENSIFKKTVFSAGDMGINSFRIPSMVTAADGSLILFAEARKESWSDKSPTDIVVKRSSDNGKSWSNLESIANGEEGAFMDPTAVVDKNSGKIFLFISYWPKDDHSGRSNTAWVLTSQDNGITWSSPKNITEQVVTTPNSFIHGFGPGRGLQMEGEHFSGRLIIPTRILREGGGFIQNKVLYSDNGGQNWRLGEATGNGGEYMVTESPLDTLIYNKRASGERIIGRSHDGGVTWTPEKTDTELETISGGVHASILGAENILFFVGPAGGTNTQTHDNRQNLTIYRSETSGEAWDNKKLIYDKASGYSVLTRLQDGRLAIAFEAGDENGFIKDRGNRPSGWMRIDLIILPREIFIENYWL